jgi:hypothetical protein
MRELDQIFEDLQILTRELNAWMETNPCLTVMDQILLENNIQMLHMIGNHEMLNERWENNAHSRYKR